LAVFKRSTFAAVALILTFSARSLATDRAPYQVSAQSASPVSGEHWTLDLLIDARINPGLAQQLWETPVDQLIATAAQPGLVESFDRSPLLPAKLQLVSSDGSITQEATLGGSVARLELLRGFERPAGKTDDAKPAAAPGHARKGHRHRSNLAAKAAARPPAVHPDERAAPVVFAATIADADGLDGFNTKVTTLYQVDGKTLQELVATDDSGKQAPITLVESVKAAWRIVAPASAPADDKNANADDKIRVPEIRQVICRPDFAEAKPGNDVLPFKLTYITYRKSNSAWHKKQRSESGFWEDDGSFPVAEKFP
jgi:hypothetical protein